MRYRIQLAGTADGRQLVQHFVDGWSRNSALRWLVESDGGEWPEAGSLLERLERLHEFSERWDFRRGGERLDIAHADVRVPEETIRRSAEALGIADHQPLAQPNYDHVIILGGTALANYCRTKLVHDLLLAGTEIRRIASLGALRAIGESEANLVRERAHLLGPIESVATTEFDVLVDAAERFLPPAGAVSLERHDDPNPHLSRAYAHYQTREGREVEVIAAPSPDPDRRAMTIDNYHSYRDRIRDGDAVLICTSAIYSPYQFFMAMRALGWTRPLSIELTGFPPDWTAGILTASENYLQETRSAIFGALTLARDLEAEG